MLKPFSEFCDALFIVVRRIGDMKQRLAHLRRMFISELAAAAFIWSDEKRSVG